MSVSGDKPEMPNQSVFTWTLAVVVGQVGCLTLVIIFAALFLGIWLDNILETKPVFTVGLIVASIPVTLVAMILVVRAATSRLAKLDDKDKINKSEKISGQTYEQ